MQVTRAEAICQEFCSEVSASQVLSGTLEDLKETDEIRCELEMKFFPELCMFVANCEKRLITAIGTSFCHTKTFDTL